MNILYLSGCFARHKIIEAILLGSKQDSVVWSSQKELGLIYYIERWLSHLILMTLSRMSQIKMRKRQLIWATRRRRRRRTRSWVERLELSWRALPVLPVARGAPPHTHLVAAVHTGVQEGHTAPGVGCLLFFLCIWYQGQHPVRGKNTFSLLIGHFWPFCRDFFIVTFFVVTSLLELFISRPYLSICP